LDTYLVRLFLKKYIVRRGAKHKLLRGVQKVKN